jgi:predicted permease
MTSFLRKLSWLIRRRDKEAELREELQFHLDEEADQRHAGGLPADEARRAARRELGDRTHVEEDTRAAWGWTIVEQLGQDLRYAFRTIAANRLFTALVVLSLGLGIGANTAIFSFVDAILLRSLPVAEPDSLVVLNWQAKGKRPPVMRSMSGSTWGDPTTGTTSGIFPFPVFEMIRAKDTVFASVFAHFRYWQTRSVNVTIHGEADLASGWHVSGGYFRGLGIRPAVGRLIGDDDDRPGAPAVAVVSHAFSERRFGGPAGAAGRSILVDNLPFTVVGVAPPGFYGVDPAASPDVYLPMHTLEYVGAGEQFGFRSDAYLDRHYYWIQIMGRLRPGITLAGAHAALAPAFHQWVASTATNDHEKANLPALVIRQGAGGLDSLRRQYSKPLWVLLALVGLILALACANVANLLLARASARRREMAVRLSIGAGRRRLVRQLLTESVVLASLGGVVGVLIAIWGMRFLTLLLANGRPGFTLHAEMNGHVLAVAAALSLLTGVLFGLAPALQATRVDVMSALKAARAGRLTPTRVLHRIRLGHLLVAFQVAIAAIVIVAAGLFVRTLSNLQSVELGFDRDNVLLFQVDARKAGHQDAGVASFYRELRHRLRAIPGVRDVSLSEDSLINAGTGLPLTVAGAPTDRGDHILNVGPEFFRTMQIPLVAGRDLKESDGPGSPAVAVINEAFARAAFGDRDPLGQRLILWESRPGQPMFRPARDMTIVGVCSNARYGGLTRPFAPVVYMPYDQGYPGPGQMVYALRTWGNPIAYPSTVRETVRRADPRVPVSEVRTQVADIDRTISQEITFARLCSAFAVLALVIACVGLYGAVSYSVTRRTSEIGIRMALGAQRGGVVQMVLREVLVLAAVGLSAGLAVAFAATRLVASFLYGLKPNDPVTLALAAVTLFCAVLAAGYLPARRASMIDLVRALRVD